MDVVVITSAETWRLKVRRQNRLSSNLVSTSWNYRVPILAQYSYNLQYFWKISIGEGIMREVYQLLLWVFVFCRYTTQEGKKTCFCCSTQHLINASRSVDFSLDILTASVIPFNTLSLMMRYILTCLNRSMVVYRYVRINSVHGHMFSFLVKESMILTFRRELKSMDVSFSDKDL